jgi:hypothetical protein
VDATIMAIVDTVDVGGKVVYDKYAESVEEMAQAKGEGA